MGDEKAQRFDDALSSLVDILVPTSTEEDEVIADEKHEHALHLAKNILDEHGSSAVTSDVQHAADLIKKKLLRQSGPPDRVIQFSNLYARLLTQPVLSQKWGILYLLHQLSDPEDEESKGDPANGVERPRQQANASANRHRRGQQNLDEQLYKDAFATGGLSKMSADTNRPTTTSTNNRLGELRDQAKAPKKTVSLAFNERDVEKVPRSSLSEAALLRDLPFTLQGLSTTNLTFLSLTDLGLPSVLPLPIVSLLYTLAEPSLLYRSLSEFVQSKDEGLIGQSLRSAVGGELRSYLGLISTLENEIRRAIASLDGKEQNGRSGKASVTLKRCVVWTREATMGLRLMSSMVGEAGNRRGGQLVSMIHGFSTSYGDPFVGAFAERMLTHVTRPFYDMLRQWIYNGELSDPYSEFFVIEQDSQDLGEDPRRAPATSVWEEKYKLDQGMIPSIVTEDFARKVFLIGKSLNFIRYSCGDSAWVEAYCKEASRELAYGDTATLENSIDEAYKTTMARLIHLMDQKFQLFEHLNALKRYLLLGQGDFVALLMESLSANLDRPAGSQYRHTLTGQLEHAIRGSNAQFDSPDILRRLDARLTEMEKGDTGWDVFTLEYKVDAPVDVIITPWANRQYLKIFNLLWRIKRVEFALGSTWRRCMTGARGVLAAVNANVKQDWKTARCAIAEMIHFINQLQYYVLFEVIEASWDTLHAATSEPDCTLDDLISAHSNYLKAITHKGLLGSTRTISSGHQEDVFTVQLHELLKTMLAYKEAVDGLYSFSLAAFTRRQELSAKIETRTAQGGWGMTEKDEEELKSSADNGSKQQLETNSPFAINDILPPGLTSTPEDAMLPALRKRLTDLAIDFKTRVNNLLGDLAVQPDVGMKFLGVVMNFNDVYTPRKKRRHVGAGDKKTPAQTETVRREDTSEVKNVSTAESRKGSGAIGTASRLAERKGKDTESRRAV